MLANPCSRAWWVLHEASPDTYLPESLARFLSMHMHSENGTSTVRGPKPATCALGQTPNGNLLKLVIAVQLCVVSLARQVVSTCLAGAAFGSLTGAALAQKFGRKGTLLLVGFQASLMTAYPPSFLLASHSQHVCPWFRLQRLWRTSVANGFVLLECDSSQLKRCLVHRT